MSPLPIRRWEGLTPESVDHILTVLQGFVTEYDIPDDADLKPFLRQNPELRDAIDTVCDADDITKLLSRIRKNRKDREAKNPDAERRTVREELIKASKTQFWLQIHSNRLVSENRRLREAFNDILLERDGLKSRLDTVTDEKEQLDLTVSLLEGDLILARSGSEQRDPPSDPCIKPEPVRLTPNWPSSSPVRDPKRSHQTTGIPIRRTGRPAGKVTQKKR